MNFLVFLPFGLLVVPLIPTFIEMFRRKDKGPRDIPEQTTYDEKPDLHVPRLERARGEARAKEPSEVIRVTGDVSIPDGTEIENHLVVQGNLKLGKNCHIRGSVKAFGNVDIGEYSIIDGHVLSEGKILIGRDSVVRGVVDSLQDITLEENATVEAVSTEKTVRLEPGARIKRRIISGVYIDIFSPKPETPAVSPEPAEPTRLPEEKSVVRRPAAEPAKPPVSEEPETKISDQIFRSLEDRIRKFGERKLTSAEEIGLNGLSPTEVKVFKLACVCRSLEEMSLRLLMDPVEVKEMLKVLIEKGYLDRDLKPKKPKAQEEFRAEVLGRKQETTPPEREEMQRKVKAETQETPRDEQKPPSEEQMRISGEKRGGIRDILKDWRRASSLLWMNEIGREESSPNEPNRTNNVKQNGTAAQDTKKKVPTEVADKSGGQNDEMGTPPFMPSDEGIERSTISPKRSLVSVRPDRASPSRSQSNSFLLLPVLALISLLLAEIFYYSPVWATVLENLLPSNVKMWHILLVLALGFGSASGLYAMKHLRRRDNMTKISERRI